MRSLMQTRPLAISEIAYRAESFFPHKHAYGPTAGGSWHGTTYGELIQRVRRLVAALDRLGLSPDAPVATLCWNREPHVELYLGIPCSGRILHTLNLRLFAEELLYVIEHAGDEAIFVDRSLLPLIVPLLGQLAAVRQIVVIDDGSEADLPDDPRIVGYEELLAGVDPRRGDFVTVDENSAAGLCYTSGTTGRPKGIVYSHRSMVLQALTLMTGNTLALCERDVVLPAVPMFHANGWGLPFAAIAAGADLVLSGRDLGATSLLDLLERHRVTIVAAVPTILMDTLAAVEGRDLSALRIVLSGGAALPTALMDGWREKIGVTPFQGWGMTETSALAAISVPQTVHGEDPEAPEALAARTTQGQPVFLSRLRLVDEDGNTLPSQDGERGELQASGPLVASGYFKVDPSPDHFTEDGWLRTGDIARVDAHGYLTLVDRTKDLIKSGGEWISSIELENTLMSHPDVAEAAVIAIPHERWQERPLAYVVPAAGAMPKAEELTEFLQARVAKWWVPERIEVVESLPRTAVGKVSKKELRDRFAAASGGGPSR
jgi:fatty-acyl-CoA synthase